MINLYSKRQLIIELQSLGLSKRQIKEAKLNKAKQIIKFYFNKGKKDKVILLYLQKININLRYLTFLLTYIVKQFINFFITLIFIYLLFFYIKSLYSLKKIRKQLNLLHQQNCSDEDLVKVILYETKYSNKYYGIRAMQHHLKIAYKIFASR